MLLCYSLVSWVNRGLVGLAETVLLLGFWEGSWQEMACSALLDAVRNLGFLESEGETLSGVA